MTGLDTDAGCEVADAYIVALGSYAPAMVKPLGVALPVYPVKGYSLTVPIADLGRAPESTVMDETYKIAITRLGDRIRVGAFGGHAERWLVLASARGLLTRAVERYRALNQHPMVARAAEILADLTAGHENPIARLSAEYRDKRRISLVGIRRDGSPCEIANMTEGTRDQVFLGLRIAAIERHAQGRKPLPFVADDLFITSDDERTACGLRALDTLAETTQVVLFTHHLSVLRSAETMAASHGFGTHVLPVRRST